MPTQYTNTQLGGIDVDRTASGENNSVEIVNSNGETRRILTDVTDLRNAKTIAESGDTITVFPGEYTTRNLLKDGVDWHFVDGAVVDNQGLSNGAFFENVGAHGSPGGKVESDITGRGEFIYYGSDSSGDAFVNVGASTESDIAIEAKRVEIPDGSKAVGALHAAGSVEVRVDTVYIGDPEGSTAAGNALASIGRLFGNDNTDSEFIFHVGTLEAPGERDGQNLGLNMEADQYDGAVDVEIDKLITDPACTSYVGASQNPGSADVRFSIKEHQGEVAYGWFNFAGTPTPFLDNFNINISDIFADNAGIWWYGDFGTIYGRNINIDHPTASASTGVFTVKTATAGVELHNLGDVKTNGAVDPDVTVVGSPVEITS